MRPMICISCTFFQKIMQDGGFFCINACENKVFMSQIWKFLTFSIHRNYKSTKKITTNDGQIKLTICDVYIIFQCKYWKCYKNFNVSG